MVHTDKQTQGHPTEVLAKYVTVNGKTYANAFRFNGKFRLVSIYHPFKTVHAKCLMVGSSVSKKLVSVKRLGQHV